MARARHSQALTILFLLADVFCHRGDQSLVSWPDHAHSQRKGSGSNRAHSSAGGLQHSDGRFMAVLLDPLEQCFIVY